MADLTDAELHRILARERQRAARIAAAIAAGVPVYDRVLGRWFPDAPAGAPVPPGGSSTSGETAGAILGAGP